MKRLVVALLPFLCLLCVMSCGASAGGDGDKDEYWDAYDGNLFEEIVRPEAEAWREVAKVIYPYVCDDDYTQWAGHVADSLCADLISRPKLSYGEQLVRLYEIQTYIIRGMSCLSAGLSLHPGTEYYGRPGGATLLLSVALFHDDADSLKACGYDSPEALMNLRHRSVYRFLNCYVSILYGGDLASESWDNNYWTPSDVLFDNLDQTQAYRWSEHLNNVEFFSLYYKLMCGLPDISEEALLEWQTKFCGGEDKHVAIGIISRSIVAMRYVNSLYYNSQNGEKIEISLEDWTAYMKQAAEYRVHMIKVFAEAIVTLSPCGKSLPSIRMFLNVEKAK